MVIQIKQCSWLLFYSMNQKNRNSFMPIPYHTLQTQIQKWCKHHSKTRHIQKRIKFKASLSELKAIDQHFQPQIIQYLTLKMFGWMVQTDKDEETTLKLNHSIKEHYREMLVEHNFHTGNLFDLFMLYHIKLTGMFVQYQFEGVAVDQVVQSELCFILYYAILGVAVDGETFRLLVKRNIICDNQKRFGMESVKSFATNGKIGKKSIFSLQSKSKRVLDQSKKIKTFKHIRFSRASVYAPFKSKKKDMRISQRQDFQIELKQNLRVDPLPTIKKKRINYRQFQRTMTEPLPGTDSKQQTPLEVISQSMVKQKPKLKYIFSNQLSSSLKTEYPCQFQFELNSRRVKLNQTMHAFNPGVQEKLDKSSDKLNYLGVRQSFEHVNGRKEVEEWQRLVDGLKKKVFNLKCKRQQSPLLKQYPSSVQMHSSISSGSRFPSSTPANINSYS